MHPDPHNPAHPHAARAAAAAAEELGLGPEEARDLRGEDGVGEVSGEVAARAGERDGVDLGGGGEEFFFFRPQRSRSGFAAFAAAF